MAGSVPIGSASAASGHGEPAWRRRLLRLIGAIVGALVVYAAWRGYQNPDLLLDLASFRLC